MINIKLYTTETCLALLEYKSDENIRSLYNAERFSFPASKFTDDQMGINLTNLDLGTNPSDDVESSIKIFEALKDLDSVQANDKRLWTTLTHTCFFEYTTKRWRINASSSNEVIKDRFHFEGAGLRQRNQNSIARLWWAAKITWDPTRSDPFELTKLLWEKQDFYQNLIDRKYSVYKGTLIGFLNFYKKNKHLDAKIEMRKLFKGINAFGGVRVLPLLNEQQVELELYNLCKFYNISVKV